jgi:hypothetical protein
VFTGLWLSDDDRIVGRDRANTVTMLELWDGKYEEVDGSPRPLSRLLDTTPQQHLS